MSPPRSTPWDLSPEAEIEAFERLKPRLRDLWALVFPRDDEPYTSVVVPSVTLEPASLRRLSGVLHVEETLLFLLIRLRNPRARIVYLTSQPIPPPVLEYYLQFLAGIPGSHARARLTLLSAYDASLRPLTEKILERPRLLERIRAAIPDPSRAYLTVFRSTPLERRLAVLLGIPLNAADPGMEALCTKSGGRKVLREAGIEQPLGREDVRSEGEVLDALLELRARRPGLRRAVLKLDRSQWDEGHALYTYPESEDPASLGRSLRQLALSVPESAESYLERLETGGGIVEEFIEGVRATASAQVRINPLGSVVLTSTHDEIRGGPTGMAGLGALFPADESYRRRVQDLSLRIGHVFAEKGLVSRLSVEFLVCEPEGEREPRLLASEVNLGVGGSTHPLLAVRFLCGGELDPRSGLFFSPRGRPKFYRVTDHLPCPRLRGLLPEDLIEILTLNHLHYSHRTESGVLFYMLGALSETGRVGMLAVGNSRWEADQVFQHTLDVLEACL